MLSYNTDDSDVNMVVPYKQFTQSHQVTKISWLHKVGTKKIRDISTDRTCREQGGD